MPFELSGFQSAGPQGTVTWHNGDKNKCYACRYRGPASESAFSSCNHPWLDKDSKESALEMVMNCGGGKMVQGSKEFVVKLGEHGIMNGWANWPLDFDPVWVAECSGYTMASFKMYWGEAVLDQEKLNLKHYVLFREFPSCDAILVEQSVGSAVVFDGEVWRELDLAAIR